MSTHPIRLMTITAALSLLAAPVLAQSAPASSNTTTSAPTTSAPATSQPTTAAPATAAGAQTPPAASGAAPSASTGANANASVPAQLAAGLAVKDNTGASIGEISKVETDGKTGQKMATIKMGSDSFRLPADRLAVDNGAATVNLTQAQIEAQLHPKK